MKIPQKEWKLRSRKPGSCAGNCNGVGGRYRRENRLHHRHCCWSENAFYREHALWVCYLVDWWLWASHLWIYRRNSLHLSMAPMTAIVSSPSPFLFLSLSSCSSLFSLLSYPQQIVHLYIIKPPKFPFIPNSFHPMTRFFLISLVSQTRSVFFWVGRWCCDLLLAFKINMTVTMMDLIYGC